MTSKPEFANSDDFVDPLENYDSKIYSDPLEKALAEQTVAKIEHHPVAKISPSATVAEALDKLANEHVGCLLVEGNGQLVGVFSDRDVLNRVALEYEEIKDKPVADLMTSEPVYVYETDCAGAALAVMAVSGFRHVPVTKLDRQIVGIISPQRVTAFLQQHAHEGV